MPTGWLLNKNGSLIQEQKKKHVRPRKSGQKGQIVEMAAPIHVSNVMISDPKTGEPTRISMKLVGDKKVRISKKSGEEI